MWWHLVSSFRCKFYHIINSENCNCGFCSKSDWVNFGNHGFKYTSLEVVSGLSIDQIKPTEFEVNFFLVFFSLSLGGSVQSSQFGDKLCCIFSCIGRQSLWDNVQGLTKFRNSNLFFAAVLFGKLVQMNAQSNIDCTSSSDNLPRFQSSFGNTNGVMKRSKYEGNYLSTSSSIYSLAPLRIIVHAVDFLHPLKKTKSLSPTASSTTS